MFWRSGIDPEGVRQFLQEALARGANLKLKIAAAEMLRQIGSPV